MMYRPGSKLDWPGGLPGATGAAVAPVDVPTTTADARRAVVATAEMRERTDETAERPPGGWVTGFLLVKVLAKHSAL
jgi:hypothetical protein